MSFETIKSDLIYRGRVFDLRADIVQLPDGQVTSLDIIVHNGAVVIVPLDSDGNVWFVHQYRHATKEILIELPAGTLEVGEDIYSCAQRELQEEIGMSAQTLEKIGQFYIAPGYSTELLHIFLARGLSINPLSGDNDEFLSVEKYPVSEVYEMAYRGVIQDSKSLAACLMAQPLLAL